MSFPAKEFKGIPMKDLRGYFKPSEVKQILAAAETLEDKLLFRLLWVTGARISEIVGDKNWKGKRFEGLRLCDIDFVEKCIYLETLKRKEYPPPRRRVTLDEKTWIFLQQYLQTKVLGKTQNIFGITRRTANNRLKKICRKIGIQKVGNKPPHVHHLRHAHCVYYIKHNNTMEGLRKLQMKLGHASIATTAHYLQFAPEEQQEVEDIFGKW